MRRCDAVEGKVLIVDRMVGVPQDSGLGLVMLIRQKLQLHVRVTGRLTPTLGGGQVRAFNDRHDQSTVVTLVPEKITLMSLISYIISGYPAYHAFLA